MRGRSITLAGIICVLAIVVKTPTWAGEEPNEERPPDEEMEMEEVIVTATRTPEVQQTVGSSIDVITAEELQEKQIDTVSEALRHVPGVNVRRTGGPGGPTSARIRGADTGHTMVLMDGVEMNDPAGMKRAFDFAHLTTDNIERIEVLRGPQSPLYGSEAMGGVINIVTKEGEGAPRHSATVEGGSFDTLRTKVSSSGGTDSMHYSASLSRFRTRGISHADKDVGNTETDPYNNTTFSSRMGAEVAPNFDIDLVMRYLESNTHLDSHGGPGGDDPNYRTDNDQLHLRTEGTLDLFEGRWEQVLGLSYSDVDRQYENKADANLTFREPFENNYYGNTIQADWQHNVHLTDFNTLTVGLESERERADTSNFGPESATTNSVFAQDRWNVWDDLFVTLGARTDDHEDFGSETTYRLVSTYTVDPAETRLQASYGTAFRAPTLFELHSMYGNPNLQAEKSEGWDVGFEQPFLDESVTVGATYFQNDFEDLIQWTGGLTGTYANVGKAKTSGVEISSSWQATEKLSLSGNYTYTRARDEITGEKLMQRPKDEYTLEARYQVTPRTTATFTADYVGSRRDYGGVSVDHYKLVNVGLSHRINRYCRLFGRIENLLDEDYQEVAGYGTPGFGVFGGIQLTY